MPGGSANRGGAACRATPVHGESGPQPAAERGSQPEIDEPPSTGEGSNSPGPSRERFPDCRPTRPMSWLEPLIDPLSVIGGIGRSTKLIVATTLIGAAIGVAIALSTPKKYEAFAELLIDPRDLKLTRPRPHPDRPAERRHAGDRREPGPHADVGHRAQQGRREAEAHRGQRVQRPATGRHRQYLLQPARACCRAATGRRRRGDRRHALAVGNLAESLHVERGGKTFVVSIGAMTEEPEKSALIANTLIEVFFKAYGELQSRHGRPRHRRIAGASSTSCAPASIRPSARSRSTAPSTISSMRRAS